jgi:LysM repeat protein
MRKTAFLAAIFVAATMFVLRGSSVSAAKLNKTVMSKKTVVVKPGDSLSSIATTNNTTYERVFYANKKIADPDVIYPGQKLRIPGKKEKLKKRPLATVQLAAPVASGTGSVASYQSAAPRPAVSAPSVGAGVWDQLAACESGGNWAINTGNGFYGGLQFTISSWAAVGGSGLPSSASRAEQIMRGKMLQARQGWGAWPACSAKLGLR